MEVVIRKYGPYVPYVRLDDLYYREHREVLDFMRTGYRDMLDFLLHCGDVFVHTTRNPDGTIREEPCQSENIFFSHIDDNPP